MQVTKRQEFKRGSKLPLLKARFSKAGTNGNLVETVENDHGVGKDKQGEEETGVINEGNTLIIDFVSMHVFSWFFDISK